MYVRLVRWAFERLYREFAWSYDAVAALVSAGRWRAWALTGLTFAGGRTLELGCGTGNLQQALAATPGIAPIGLDRSPQMLGLARRKRRRSHEPSSLLRADARAIPLREATVDSVVATFPSEYIADRGTVAEIRRVLRPGGHVAVALWAQLAGDSPYHRALDLAYRLTLQRSPAARIHSSPNGAEESLPIPAAQRRLAESLARAGFHVSFESIPAPGSLVHFVVGTLPDRADPGIPGAPEDEQL
jgi:SAM-dependent methyltransferase